MAQKSAKLKRQRFALTLTLSAPAVAVAAAILKSAKVAPLKNRYADGNTDLMLRYTKKFLLSFQI